MQMHDTQNLFIKSPSVTVGNFQANVFKKYFQAMSAMNRATKHSRIKAMFTLYWMVKWSVAESVPDRASVHTRNTAFEAVSAPKQYCSTEQKVRAHAHKCEKSFACNLEQHLWNTGNILYFVLLVMCTLI